MNIVVGVMMPEEILGIVDKHNGLVMLNSIYAERSGVFEISGSSAKLFIEVSVTEAIENDYCELSCNIGSV